MKDGSTVIGSFTACRATVDFAWNVRTSESEGAGDRAAPLVGRRRAAPRGAAAAPRPGRRVVRTYRRRLINLFIPHGPRPVLGMFYEGPPGRRREVSDPAAFRCDPPACLPYSSEVCGDAAVQCHAHPG